MCGLDDDGRYWEKLIRRGAKTHYINEDLSHLDKLRKASEKIHQYLGDTKEELLLWNGQIIEQDGETLRQLSQSRRAIKEQEERVKELERRNKKLSQTITEEGKVEAKLRAQLEKSTSPDQRKRLDEEVRRAKKELEEQRAKNQNTMRENNAEIDRLRQQLEDEPDGEIRRQIERLEAENERLGEQNEEIFSRRSLRDKVKYIIKKYGLTVFGVLAAVGTVIVANLKAGLTNVAKGVGAGFKEVGEKLGQILPGMVGANVSFLFKAAGEAVGFLAKHAWLLIMLVLLPSFIEIVRQVSARGRLPTEETNPWGKDDKSPSLARDFWSRLRDVSAIGRGLRDKRPHRRHASTCFWTGWGGKEPRTTPNRPK